MKWLRRLLSAKREEEVRGEIALFDRLEKAGCQLDENGWARKKELVDELAAIRAGIEAKGDAPCQRTT